MAFSYWSAVNHRIHRLMRRCGQSAANGTVSHRFSELERLAGLTGPMKPARQSRNVRYDAPSFAKSGWDRRSNSRTSRRWCLFQKTVRSGCRNKPCLAPRPKPPRVSVLNSRPSRPHETLVVSRTHDRTQQLLLTFVLAAIAHARKVVSPFVISL